jgi:hypothetical protein
MIITVYGIGGFDPTKPNNNIVEQYEVPDPVPNKISMRQMRLALLQQNLLNDVQALVDASGNEAYRIEWEYANDVLRTATLVTLFSGELDLTEQQVDDIFILGATL